MFDDLVAPKPATFQWLLHAHDRIEVEEQLLTVRRDPAEMKVHMLLPRKAKFSQTDEYDPEPESLPSKPRDSKATWHLTASTGEPRPAGRFLTVFQVRRRESEVTLLEGRGTVGVLLGGPDGSHDVVAFRTDPDAAEVTCGKLTSAARVFAAGWDSAGKVTRRLGIGREAGRE